MNTPDLELESDALHAIVKVVTASPDLDSLLAGVVGLLTEATACHACFIYLAEGSKLRLRAASRMFGHLIGRVEFGLDEGLAGWAARTGTAAFVADDVQHDPRFKYVPEIDADRFQSLVAVPMPGRDRDAIGVVVLHTEAPREFDVGTISLLENTASLVAGAIENAALYEAANRRVGALTALTRLAERIAGATTRDDLYRTVTEGVRTFLRCDRVALQLSDVTNRRLEAVASDPPQDFNGADHVDVPVPISAGGESLGQLVATSSRAFTVEEDELLRAVASQTAVALKRAELIERLTNENLNHQVFDALRNGNIQLVRHLARRTRFNLDRPFLVVVAGPTVSDTRPWGDVSEGLEHRIRLDLPGSICDRSSTGVQALLPLRSLLATQAPFSILDTIGRQLMICVGSSEPVADATAGSSASRQAADSQRIARMLHPSGGALAYHHLGAYKFLVHVVAEDKPHDRLQGVLDRLEEYDTRRQSSLLTTLETYLNHGRSSVKPPAHSLFMLTRCVSA